MTDVVRINATIDRALLDRVDQFAARHTEDRSTAIRQLLRTAFRELAKDEAITAYRQQRLTLRQLADPSGAVMSRVSCHRFCRRQRMR